MTMTHPAPLLPPRWLPLARAVWWVLTGYTTLTFLVGLALTFAQLRTICDPPACLPVHGMVLTSEQALALRGTGVSLDLYALLVAGQDLALAGLCVACGLLIYLRRPDERIAFLASLALIVTGTHLVPGTASALYPYLPWLLHVGTFTYLWGNALFPTLLFLLPDGRLVPPWSRWFYLLFVATLFYGVLTSTPEVEQSPNSVISVVSSSVVLVCAAIGVYGQVHRYRRSASVLVRKQILWLALGLLGAVVLIAVFAVAQTFTPAATSSPLTYWPITIVGFRLGFACIPLAITIAILRYHLWNIDVIIRRTLIYATLTALLALVYLGLVVALQTLVGGLTGQSRSELVTVLSTLAIAALFVPLRRRVQNFIDRRFYRSKYNAAQVLAAFGASLRDETDLARLSHRLETVVDHTMQPASTSLWLRPPQ